MQIYEIPKRNIDVSEYQSEVKALLGDTDCTIFIDTNILSQLYRLNDKARQVFYKWVESCGDRFHIPTWVIHEYSALYTWQAKGGVLCRFKHWTMSK